MPGRFLLLLLSFAVGGACRTPADARVEALGGDPERGGILVREYGCGACHTIPGVSGANGRVGPPLWGVADRGYIAGVLPNTEQAMIRWVRNPPAVTPRTAMPDVGVTEEDARDITAYLYTLRAEPVLRRMVRGFLERFWRRETAEVKSSTGARLRPAARGRRPGGSPGEA